MLYTIELQEMEFKAYHGCFDLEQKVGNRFKVNLKITTELGAVAEEDDITQAVNYFEVYQRVREVMAHKQRTIEAVALRIISAVRTLYPHIEQIECTVAKLAPPLGGKVAKASVTLKG
ncbi:MAG: dihydroneopterin aldolase [Alistipes sp.]|nr:dihydroneopterin aldolase [Alistipes sp.]MBQ5786451.1 dihydroneopterin aldolase [Alistipes sp.]